MSHLSQGKKGSNSSRKNRRAGGERVGVGLSVCPSLLCAQAATGGAMRVGGRSMGARLFGDSCMA